MAWLSAGSCITRARAYAHSHWSAAIEVEAVVAIIATSGASSSSYESSDQEPHRTGGIDAARASARGSGRIRATAPAYAQGAV
jgi:hypothetical protein